MTEQEEMNRRFDELAGVNCNMYLAGTVWTHEQARNKILTFLQSEKDLAVAKERKRIVEMVEKVELKVFNRLINKEVVEFYQDAVEETKRIILSLITNEK